MKKIIFLTGTRADYGKIKSVMKKLDDGINFDIYIYVSGMHLLEKYGSTYKEIIKDNFKNIYLSKPINNNLTMDEILANTILQFSNYVKKIKPDMIFVHGDRIESLAGAIVGSLNNIYVSHIEGGEISGTIDESIRHSISKLANFHFASNEIAKKNLIQLGEDEKRIFVVGSPDIDIMLKNNYNIEKIKKRYDICFDNYSILIYHPVVSEIKKLNDNIKNVVDAVIESKKNYIVIYPNNDIGNEIIIKELERLKNNKNIKIFSSIRFEYFLTLLKNAEFVIGNSSLGIRESGIYGIPTINIGTRQNGRYDLISQKNIVCVNENREEILEKMKDINNYRLKNIVFGDGNSNEKIYEILKDEKIWNIDIQKKFITMW